MRFWSQICAMLQRITWHYACCVCESYLYVTPETFISEYKSILLFCLLLTCIWWWHELLDSESKYTEGCPWDGSETGQGQRRGEEAEQSTWDDGRWRRCWWAVQAFLTRSSWCPRCQLQTHTASWPRDRSLADTWWTGENRDCWETRWGQLRPPAASWHMASAG